MIAEIWGQILTLLFVSCVMLDRLLYLSEPPYSDFFFGCTHDMGKFRG